MTSHPPRSSSQWHEVLIGRSWPPVSTRSRRGSRRHGRSAFCSLPATSSSGTVTGLAAIALISEVSSTTSQRARHSLRRHPAAVAWRRHGHADLEQPVVHHRIRHSNRASRCPGANTKGSQLLPQRQRAVGGQQHLGPLIPVLILFAGLSARIRDWAQHLGRKWFFTIGLYFIAFTVIVFLIDLPLSYYQGYMRQHAYGLSNQTFGKWAQDEVTGLVVGLVGRRVVPLGALSAAEEKPATMVAVHRAPRHPVHRPGRPSSRRSGSIRSSTRLGR